MQYFITFAWKLQQTDNQENLKYMKKVIFTQEWIALHLYEKADETDLYCAELANETDHALA